MSTHYSPRIVSAASAILGLLAALAGPATAQPQFEVVHAFASGSAAGWRPMGELIADSNNAIYGTTQAGGKVCPTGEYSCGGTVYRLSPPATSGSWQYKLLYSFKGGKDGAAPAAGIVLRPDNGLIHGTTEYGGDLSCWEPHGCTGISSLGCGIVFRYGIASGTYEVLYRFQRSDGAWPIGHLAFDRTGNVYGVTQYGGMCSVDTRGCGIVYRLSPPPQLGQTWTQKIMHIFSGGADGKQPSSGVLRVGGVLYGTTGTTLYAVTP